ncbi:B-box zinc finger protein 20 isoform X3 [Manihot esculenta]|uniref:B-box zinc finger protein 20 isoform X3 n=1 Tax=Manihot esculenta TaxID=3983 RepID=UPI001CC5E320|nr:B-box zinc finger protein 20 isoform X3 [Manihot esculenta]
MAMFSLTSSKKNYYNNHSATCTAKDTIREKRMKIRCDVCDMDEASVFCSADEAALCDACDRHVHHANKLASKHLRFSLLHPSSKQSPLCDVCQVGNSFLLNIYILKKHENSDDFHGGLSIFFQERRAFLFCQEDRAILCRECDIPIHEVNDHMKKHNRFLLTGVKLSASSSLHPRSSSSNSCNTNMNTNGKKIPQQLHLHNPCSFSDEIISSPSVERPSPSLANQSPNSDNISLSTSSISEYLETLPGWRVDDFLEPSMAAHDGFCKGIIVETHEHYPFC